MKSPKHLLLIAILFLSVGMSGQHIQLAGNSLNEYPWFEFVKAFNVNATVELAIDPHLHTEIIGQTADIYIVEAKNATEWDSDPSLVDVTNNGFYTATFTSADIQGNTFVISNPDELSSMAWSDATNDYTGLGHGYDVIIDMNQDGIYNGNDFIDGYGDEAGLYVIQDVTQ